MTAPSLWYMRSFERSVASTARQAHLMPGVEVIRRRRRPSAERSWRPSSSKLATTSVEGDWLESMELGVRGTLSLPDAGAFLSAGSHLAAADCDSVARIWCSKRVCQMLTPVSVMAVLVTGSMAGFHFSPGSGRNRRMRTRVRSRDCSKRATTGALGAAATAMGIGSPGRFLIWRKGMPSNVLSMAFPSSICHWVASIARLWSPSSSFGSAGGCVAGSGAVVSWDVGAGVGGVGGVGGFSVGRGWVVAKALPEGSLSEMTKASSSKRSPVMDAGRLGSVSVAQSFP